MYVKKLFSDKEQVMVNIRLHWVKSIAPWFFGLFTIILFVAAVVEPDDQAVSLGLGIGCFILWGYYWLKNKTTEMVMTNCRVISKQGIVSVHMGEIRNNRIESIKLHQSICGRLFGYGDIELIGTGNNIVVLQCVDNPSRIVSQIKNTIDATKMCKFC